MSATAVATAAPAPALVPMNNSLGRRAWRRLMAQKMVVICLGIIALYLLIALAGAVGLLPDYQERVGPPNEAPALTFSLLLGTDVFGRSVMYKILAGTQTAMTIGFLVTAISLPIGITMGALAGYYGGKIDAAVTWLYSVITSVPYILLLIAVSFLLGKGLLSICIAMGSIGWVGLCRLTRGEFMKQKSMEYVTASRLLGSRDARIIFRHILPNTVHLAIVTASLEVLGAIKSEVVLTFLGVGIQDGSSWGTMIADSVGELVQGIWWPLVGVTIAMFFIIYALNVVGDALRDALEPQG